MIRRLYQFILLIGFIFVLYLVLVRATITWVQYAPEHFYSFVENVTDTLVEVEQIDIEQSWLGLDVEINGLGLENKKFALNAGKIGFDFNIFSPWLPNTKFGEQVNIDLVDFRFKQQQKQLQNKNVALPKFAKKIFNKAWQSITLSNIFIAYPYQKNLEIGVKRFQFNLANNASFEGVSEIVFDGKRKSEFEYKGNFSTDFRQGIQEGEAHFSVTKSVELADIYSLLKNNLDEKILQKLPTGTFVGKAILRLTQGKIADLQLSSSLQSLSWQEKKNMPQDVSFSLNMEPAITGEPARFKFEKILLDQQAIKTISPVFLTIKSQNKLAISAEKFDILAVKPVYESLLKSFGHADKTGGIKTLSLKKINLEYDLKTHNISALSFVVPNFHMPQNNWIPGIKFKNLHFSLLGENVQLDFKNGFNLLVDYIRKNPIRFESKLPYNLLVNATKQQWQLKKINLSADNMPIKLQANGDFAGDLDLKLHIRPRTLKKVKQYLPYSVMTADLERWLKEALVSGKNVKGNLIIKGNMKDFPFKKGKGKFYAEATLEDGELKFQPDWPSIHSFAGKLIFTPYNLTIKTNKARLKNVSVNDVTVKVFNLASDNIAVDISGKAHTSAVNGIEFLQSSPLLKWAEIDGFIQNNVALKGNVSLDLAKVWVPVYGFDKHPVTVRATTELHGVDVRLFDAIKIAGLKGQLNITENSVTSPKRLTGEFQKGKAEYLIKTSNDIIHITGAGVAEVTQMSAEFLSGSVPWEADVKLPLKGESLISISANASLRQAKSKLPAPFDDFGKLNSAFVKGELILGKNSNDLQIKLSDEFLAKVTLSEDFKRLQNFELSTAKNNVQFSKNPKGNSYLIHGLINRVDLDGWSALIADNFSGSSSNHFYNENKWQPSNLTIQNLKFFERNFKKVALNLYPVTRNNSQEMIVSVKSKEIDLLASRTKKGNFTVNLEKLVLKEIKESQQPTQDSQATIYSCQVVEESITLPNILFRGKNIDIGNKHMAKLEFNLVDLGDTISAQDVVMKLGDKHGLIKGDYIYYKKQKLSHIEGSATSDDIKQVLDFIGVKKGIQGKKLMLNASLKWPGFIDCFSRIKIKGKLSYKLKSGVIKDAEPGLARILGLLSLESLARRLSLDIKDVTKAGLAFDSIEGYGRFNKGIFGIEKLSLKAPAADAEVFGEINLIEENMALTADITPAIGSSLPLIAAISGFATPIAGLAAYALLKVIPGINEDLITYQYKINGNFSNPEIIDKGVSINIINANVHEEDTSILDLE